ARAAVARYYAERGLAVEAERVVLSASTSEAYAWLFKLLTDRGSAVLVPAPSYPLLDLLAELEDVRLVRYPLLRQERWRIDVEAVERAVNSEVRALVVVHPNNPTGSFLRRDDAEALVRVAAERGLALIVDEVFGDYAHGALAPDRLPSFVEIKGALTFVLSGLSKVALLPQLKLAWIAASGPDASVAEAMRRLEIIADTYLSVATPLQHALGELLGARARLQGSVRRRVEQSLRALDEAVAARGAGLVMRLPVDGGWYAMLELPKTHSEDEWVELFVRSVGVTVHPGY